jgi:hypothetical protein
MQLARPHLTVLLNALYDTGTTTIPVEHPSDEVGELFRIEFDDSGETTVRLTTDLEAYADARSEVNSQYGEPAISELPDQRSYLSAFIAGGLLEPANRAEIDDFLTSNGGRDLNAGHRPLVAGFDTNLVPWRIADVLGLLSGEQSAVNGFALATGVLDELEWGYKRSDTQSLTETFSADFEELWNQPAGSSREGRLGENYYRRLRDSRYAEEVPTDEGDEPIVDGYASFQNEGRKDVMLFSNDRDFIERAHANRVLAQRIEFPSALSRKVTTSWEAIQDTLYVLTVLFGVLSLPKVTLYGVWKGKEGMDWHDEALKLNCRSPKVEPLIERDIAIVEAHEQM